jgi:hypothetical protein
MLDPVETRARRILGPTPPPKKTKTADAKNTSLKMKKKKIKMKKEGKKTTTKKGYRRMHVISIGVLG